ncbi:Piso0_000489 [Millerozyma farinosa CBS 7064]|uniref:Piso0_000489 protein n=1 Tax=Pichia sorbitophila (strain ATCC MYA-4447 / BCRC 22081 / CBS 7064 / NBRC 10061 / NRRL Y-12695) TaxID=559304 RepID=G8YU47_PICSO|nr:Piso0_000489 [Millerozyma farinosa CBS 7064]CCE73448.1 Piso0_000489 [Millerozyma farinosa CBS 7064]
MATPRAVFRCPKARGSKAGLHLVEALARPNCHQMSYLFVRSEGGLVVKACQILVSWSVWQWIDFWHWLVVCVELSSDWKRQQEQWCRQPHGDRRKEVWFGVSVVTQPSVRLVSN